MKKANPSFSFHGPSLPAPAPAPPHPSAPSPTPPPERPLPEHFSTHESWLPHAASFLLQTLLHGPLSLPRPPSASQLSSLLTLREQKQGSSEALACCFDPRPCLVLAGPRLGHQRARPRPHVTASSVLGCGSEEWWESIELPAPRDCPLKPQHAQRVAGYDCILGL